MTRQDYNVISSVIARRLSGVVAISILTCPPLEGVARSDGGGTTLPFVIASRISCGVAISVLIIRMRLLRHYVPRNDKSKKCAFVPEIFSQSLAQSFLDFLNRIPYNLLHK